jgi:hypothetical protein
MRYDELWEAVRSYLLEKVGGNIASGCPYSPEAAALLAHGVAEFQGYAGEEEAGTDIMVNEQQLGLVQKENTAGDLRFHSNVKPQSSPPVSKSLQASHEMFSSIRAQVQGQMTAAAPHSLHVVEPLKCLVPAEASNYNLNVTYQEYVSILAKRVEDKAMRRVAVPEGSSPMVDDGRGTSLLRPRQGTSGARKRTEMPLKVKNCTEKARVSASWYTSTQFAPSNKPPPKKVLRSSTKPYPHCEQATNKMAKKDLRSFERETLG